MVWRGLQPRLLLIPFCLLAWTGVAADPKQEAARLALIEKYNRESDPKDRIKIATRLTDADMKELRSAYREDEPGERAAIAIEKYLSTVDLLRKAVQEAGIRRASKDAEIHLRKQHRELEQLRMNLSFLDQGPLEPALESVAKAHEEALHMIMR